MPATALSRVGARMVQSGPGGSQELAAGMWQKLEALPDPRSPRGRIYPLACLVAIALCAFTAAGNDRLTAVGQWISRAGQADLARLRAPWDPMAGRYRVPDEKTIRVVLDRLDPRALARALLGPRPDRRRGAGILAVDFLHVDTVLLKRICAGVHRARYPPDAPGRRHHAPDRGLDSAAGPQPRPRPR